MTVSQAPLTPAVLNILLSLSDQERHGYGIMQEVQKMTGDQVLMGPGTLYGTLKRMLEAGLIEESEERPDPALDDERRRYYRITPSGRAALAEEVSRMQRLLAAAQAKRIPNPGQP
jgi:DNA-binding PadR family transcriptional regulator